MLKISSILVASLAEFIGSNLLTKLLEKGHFIVGIDNLTMRSMKHIGDYLKHGNSVVQ